MTFASPTEYWLIWRVLSRCLKCRRKPVMTMIIYVLYALFDTIQSALRKNAAQVDVNEGGRAAAEMIVRELSQWK